MSYDGAKTYKFNMFYDFQIGLAPQPTLFGGASEPAQGPKVLDVQTYNIEQAMDDDI